MSQIVQVTKVGRQKLSVYGSFPFGRLRANRWFLSVRKVLENRSLQDEERANQVEEQLKEAQSLAEGLFYVKIFG